MECSGRSPGARSPSGAADRYSYHDDVPQNRLRAAGPPDLPMATHEFELGEDNPANAEARARQESSWFGSQIDGRKHYSLREQLQLQKPAIINSFRDYCRVRTLHDSMRRASGTQGEDDEAAAVVAAAHNTAAPLTEKLTPELMELIVDAAMPGQGPVVPAMSVVETLNSRSALAEQTSRHFSLFIRARPLSAQEESLGEYSSMRVERRLETGIKRNPDAACGAGARLVVHSTKLARTGRRMTVTHHWFGADRVFGPKCGHDAVDGTVLQPLLCRAASGDGDATVILYGQTGSGKTHTLMGMLAHVQAFLDQDQSRHVALSFFEVANGAGRADACLDLLCGRKPLKLLADEEETVHARGARTVVVRSGEELRHALAGALALRSTLATEANAVSSRSHAVCALRFLEAEQAEPVAPTPGDATGGGGVQSPASRPAALKPGRTMRLVDLAGSERNYETHHMTSREFQRESVAINQGLMALKDCFREAARLRREVVAVNEPQVWQHPPGSGPVAVPRREAVERSPDCSQTSIQQRLARPAEATRMPYRASMLTRVLRSCFADPAHRTSVVATVAPGAQSVLHTLSTLQHVSLMAPHAWAEACTVDVAMRHQDGASFSYVGVPVHEWTAEHVTEWLTNVDGGRFSQVVVPAGTTGVKLLQIVPTLTEMIESEQAAGREDGESWYVSSGAAIGRTLFAALREAQRREGFRGAT